MSHSQRFIQLGQIMAFLVAGSILWFQFESRAADLVISEFMAANHNSLLDEDGEASDWIELHNPTSAPIQLAGWSLTDEESVQAKWIFPERLLEPGGFLVVFASGKNRTGTGPLHTNFRLEAGGEYLALFPPGAGAPASVFAPRFPTQETDISFGIPMSGGTRDLLTGSPVWVLLPTAAAQLPSDWAQAGVNPGNDWTQASGFALGYDATPAGPETSANLARNGVAAQSTTGFGLLAANAIDGDPGTFTHTDSNDNASTWWLDLGALTEISRVVLHNREDCCGSRLRDLTVNLLAADGQTVVWTSGLLNRENSLGSPRSLTLDLFELNVGAVHARMVQVIRTPDPDLSGSNGIGNEDEDNVLSLGEVEVYGVASVSFAPLIRSELAGTMKGRASAAFVRVPFVLDNLEGIRSLALQLRFDDGVIVFLNGAQIAVRNAPVPAAWNSTATVKRDKSAALQLEQVDLVPYRSLWRTGTNWLALQGLNASVEDSEFLLDAQLLAGAAGAQFNAYLERPTPGAPNNAGWNLGRVADTKFSVNRGLFEAPFDLVLSTATPEAEIRYTLDGTVPSDSNGQVYAGPLPIQHTTVVRAAAFKPGFRPTDVDTQTYIFPASVVAQPASPPGFPTTWASVAADYQMDPDITQAPAYANRMIESLRALPSLAITTPNDNLFSTTRGIYANPERTGVDWERPASVEWIRADGPGAFQIDGGLRIQGGYFRQRTVTQKHSLRLLFKGAYGAGRLQQNLFGEFGAAQDFDTLVLRAGANDGYAWDDARDTEQFIRDEFGRRLLLAMGEPSPRGQFVHLYLNGLYWGLYNLTERPAEDFSATYLGGAPEDWDAINSGEIKAGSLEAWNAFLVGVRNVRTLADYQKLKGLNPDGSRNSAVPEYFDSTNYIDYMLVNIWGGNWDWPNKNFWFGRHRGGLAGGFKFYLWDFENTMGNNRDRSPLDMIAPRAGLTDSWVAEPHAQLMRFSEYQMDFADRVQRHFFDGGVLTPESLISRYQALANHVELAVIAETARWGDDHWPKPQDLTDWQRERDWILGTYLPQRTGIVLDQLREAGLIPKTSAPRITPPGGSVTRTTPIQLSADANELFYTTNGFDPRLPGGEVRPGAIRVSANGNSTTTSTAGSLFLSAPASIKARARQGTEWSALHEASFAMDVVAATSNHLVIAEFCYRPAAPATPAERALTKDADDFEFIEVMNTATQAVDLTDVRFTAGILFDFANGTALQPGERVLVAKNRTAFEARYGQTHRIAGQYDGNLSNSGEEIVLQDGMGQDIRRFHYLDQAPWPASANADGYSLVLRQPGSRPDHNNPRQWRASVQPGGSPGTSDSSNFSGSPIADANGNAQADLLDHAFGAVLSDSTTGLVLSIESSETDGEPTQHLVITLPCNLAADDTQVILETAVSLAGPWQQQPGDFTLIREERSAPGTVRQSFRMNAPIQSAAFVRVSVALIESSGI